jgi:drug/metabolite transporter (DMT)-like permease
MLGIYLCSSVLFMPLSDPAKLLTLSGSHFAILIFCGLNTLVTYGAFAAALEHWEASKVSAIITLAPLVTLVASVILPSFMAQLLPPSPLSWWGYVGAIAVVSGSLTISLSSKPLR